MSKPNQRLLNDLFSVRVAGDFEVKSKRTAAGTRYVVRFNKDEVTDWMSRDRAEAFLKQAMWTRASQVITALLEQ